jgi:hemolysin-activating ACP:hemolysin acyltransferase
MSPTSQLLKSAPQSNGAPAPAADAPKHTAARTSSPPSEAPASAAASHASADGTVVGMAENIQRDAATLRNALAFTQALGVMMRSPHYKKCTFADLEWLVIPPLMMGQFRIGEAKPDPKGPALPVAIVFWALVSPTVDKRLMKATSDAPHLTPEEWKSGDIPWLVHAAGETRFVRSVVDQLMKSTFRGREVKVLASDRLGRAKVHVLGRPSTVVAKKRPLGDESMISRSGYRLSEEIMLERIARAR